MAHAALKSLPPEVLTKLDVELVKGRSCTRLAMGLHDLGYLKNVKVESLARELRKYRDSAIKEPEAARALSIARSPNPAQQKRVLEKAHDFDVMANMFMLIQAQEKRVKKWLDVGAGNMPSTAILNDIKTLADMFVKFNTACMDRGLLPRAATTVSLRAEMIVVDGSNVEAVIKALLDYMNNDDAKDVFGENLGWQREFVERAHVRHVVKQVARIANMPQSEFEQEFANQAVIDATVVRVE